MKKCLHCGKDTTNLKFCCKECYYSHLVNDEDYKNEKRKKVQKGVRLYNKWKKSK